MMGVRRLTLKVPVLSLIFWGWGSKAKLGMDDPFLFKACSNNEAA
jgi:hypothetical protein